jgi:putative ABC transport system permease protein
MKASAIALAFLMIAACDKPSAYKTPEPGTYRVAARQLGIANGFMTAPVASVRPDFFRAAGASPMLGRTFIEPEGAAGAVPVAVIGHDLWQRQMNGDPAVIGQTVTLDGRPTTVVGIMPKDFMIPDGAMMWVPQR